jgi:hypothetical protein
MLSEKALRNDPDYGEAKDLFKMAKKGQTLQAAATQVIHKESFKVQCLHIFECVYTKSL